MPAGIALVGPAFHDSLIAAVSARFHAAVGIVLGAGNAPLPAPEARPRSHFPYLPPVTHGTLRHVEVGGLGAGHRPASRDPAYRDRGGIAQQLSRRNGRCARAPTRKERGPHHRDVECPRPEFGGTGGEGWRTPVRDNMAEQAIAGRLG